MFLYLGVMLVIPLLLLLFNLTSASPEKILLTLQNPRVIAAFRVTVLTAFGAAVVNLIFGTLIAWVQVKYRYPGQTIVSMLIDLPFALPTAVAGIALTATFSSQSIIGRWLQDLGIQVNYTPLGIAIAMVFIGIPFVIRHVEPVLEDLGSEMEEAAAMLGATAWLRFRRVIFPNIVPAALAGFTSAFARGLGEYGSVIFISGNMPLRTEVVSLLIVSKLEQFDYTGAVIIATAMLALALFFLLISNGLQYWQKRRLGI
jgi:sulfate transport system permease protein